MTDSYESLPSDQREKKKGNGAFIAVIILLLLGLGVMAYLWSTKNSELNTCENDNKTLNADMNGMNEMLEGYVGNLSNDLKSDFQNMLETYDLLKEKDKSKADSINVQKAKIQGLLDDLKNNKNMSAHQLMLLRKENETLRKIMKGYVIQIDSLNTLNLRLESDLDSTSTELGLTKEERDELAKKNDDKDAQLTVAGKLQAHNFASGALKSKLGGSMAETNKVRNAAQLKSSFTISENTVTEKGSKSVYMQIVDPAGKTIQLNSGNIATIGGKKIAFTNSRAIDYQGKRIDVTIYQDLNDTDLAKGNYQVKIYCDGHMIGTDSFTLK
ncbi:MAG: hypothetical protein ACI837_000092 [Crocinitomicaceae bacterium]|jgi:hypothetical protein